MWGLHVTLGVVYLCTCARGLLHATGYVGGRIEVSCPYPKGYRGALKYLCRNNCYDNDIVVMTNKPDKGRYSIRDDKNRRVFTTTISELRTTDAGKYWCGVDKSMTDLYTEIHLKVHAEICCITSYNLSAAVGLQVTLTCPSRPGSPGDEGAHFFCKGKHPASCGNVMQPDAADGSEPRITLGDAVASGSFKVTIAELRAEDAGTYWCGSEPRWGIGNFAKIHLSVVFPQKNITAISSDPRSFSLQLPVILGAFAFLVGFLLTLPLFFICCRRRHRRTEEAAVSGEAAQAEEAAKEEEDDEPDYENMQQNGGDVKQHKEALKQHKGALKQPEGALKKHKGALKQHKGALKPHEGAHKLHEGAHKQRGVTLKQQERPLKQQSRGLRKQGLAFEKLGGPHSFVPVEEENVYLNLEMGNIYQNKSSR